MDQVRESGAGENQQRERERKRECEREEAEKQQTQTFQDVTGLVIRPCFTLLVCFRRTRTQKKWGKKN